jgi:DNA repair protein RadD
MQLRDYQKNATDVIWEDLMNEQRVLLEAATGSGKTVIFDELIRRFMTRYPKMRKLVVAHRQELVMQAYHKLIRVWPEGVEKIGLACSGTGIIDTTKEVTIGSVQTLCRRKIEGDFRLLIVDECHHIPSIETGGQYYIVMEKLQDNYPNLRILGVTATPFRLGHGYIYGDKCKSGQSNFFPRLNYRIGMDELTKQGYLVPIRAKEGISMENALSEITIKKGDYDLAELSEMYQNDCYLKAAVNSYKQHGEGRENVLIFAVTIAHANKLKEAFLQEGFKADAVSSENSNEERFRILNDFERGKINILVNVGILTEGWDNPKVDLILMCRPTKAPALFTQMVGRGMRPFPHKKDILILDLAENFKTHGRPADPLVIYNQKRKRQCSQDYISCPNCQEFVLRASENCPNCGHVFRNSLFTLIKQNSELKTETFLTAEERELILKEEILEAKSLAQAQDEVLAQELQEKLEYDEVLVIDEVLEQEQDLKEDDELSVEVLDFQKELKKNKAMELQEKVESFKIYKQKTIKGYFMAVLHVYLQRGGCVRQWLDIEGNYSSKGQYFASKFWNNLSGGKTPPISIQEAIERENELNIPQEVTTYIDGFGFKKIKGLHDLRM